MKKLLMTAFISTMLFTQAEAYYIGGQFVSLVSCNWGKYGYKHGYIGLYRANDGQTFRIFSGSNYCSH